MLCYVSLCLILVSGAGQKGEQRHLAILRGSATEKSTDSFPLLLPWLVRYKHSLPPDIPPSFPPSQHSSFALLYHWKLIFKRLMRGYFCPLLLWLVLFFRPLRLQMQEDCSPAWYTPSLPLLLQLIPCLVLPLFLIRSNLIGNRTSGDFTATAEWHISQCSVTSGISSSHLLLLVLFIYLL